MTDIKRRQEKITSQRMPLIPLDRCQDRLDALEEEGASRDDSWRGPSSGGGERYPDGEGGERDRDARQEEEGEEEERRDPRL